MTIWKRWIVNFSIIDRHFSTCVREIIISLICYVGPNIRPWWCCGICTIGMHPNLSNNVPSVHEKYSLVTDTIVPLVPTTIFVPNVWATPTFQDILIHSNPYPSQPDNNPNSHKPKEPNDNDPYNSTWHYCYTLPLAYHPNAPVPIVPKWKAYSNTEHIARSKLREGAMFANVSGHCFKFMLVSAKRNNVLFLTVWL